jgi:hypothetical protein
MDAMMVKQACGIGWRDRIKLLDAPHTHLFIFCMEVFIVSDH